MRSVSPPCGTHPTRLLKWAVVSALIGCLGGQSSIVTGGTEGDLSSSAGNGSTTPAPTNDNGNASSSPQPASTGASAGAGEVIFVGRTVVLGEGRRLAWPGIAIGFRFFGTSAAVDMQHTPALFHGDTYAAWFDVQVDGADLAPIKVDATRKKTVVAQDLTNAQHTVWLRKRTEAIIGVTDYFGLDLGNGRLLDPPPRPTRRIEVVGSSSETGYGAEKAPCPTPGYRSEEQNCNKAWPGQLAVSLDAEVVHVTYAGKGLMYSIFPDGAPLCPPLAQLYNTVVPINIKQPQTCAAPEAAQMYNFSGDMPQLVLLNLTSIDARGRPYDVRDPKPDYTQQMLQFIDPILARNPSPWVLLMTLPSSRGTQDLAWVLQQVTAVKAAYQARGQKKVDIVRAEAVPLSGDLGCDGHPSVQQHQRIAAEVATQVKALVGW